MPIKERVRYANEEEIAWCRAERRTFVFDMCSARNALSPQARPPESMQLVVVASMAYLSVAVVIARLVWGECSNMLMALWRKFDSDWGWNLSRLLAFTFLTALFAVLGLILIVLAFVLHFFGAHVEQSDMSYVFGLLPNHITASAAASFAHSLRATPEPLLLLGLPIALWYSTRFFVVLESCLCVIFRRERRSFMLQNRMALAMLGVFLLLLPIIIFSVTLTPHLPFVSPTLSSASRGAVAGDGATLVVLRASPVWTTVGILAGLVANFALLLVVYMRVTPGYITAWAAWPGALLSATLAQGYLLIFPLYTRYILQPDHFGSIAGFVLVALMFFFAYGFLVVLGAEVASWRAGIRSASHEITAALAHLHLLRASANESSTQQQPSAREFVLNAEAEPHAPSLADSIAERAGA